MKANDGTDVRSVPFFTWRREKLLGFYPLESDSGVNITSDTQLPGEDDSLSTNIAIGVNETHNYTLTIKFLNKNQAQTIRKVAPKIGKKSEVWEHAIPANYIVDELIKMIEKRDISNLEKLLDIYEFAGQRGITKVEDLQV